MQGAGGVGGLLAVRLLCSVSGSSVFFPAYDGNGNITEYLESDGDIAAHFEYDPYGTLTRRTGTVSEVDSVRFEYRFSTKPRDPATGWYYTGIGGMTRSQADGRRET